MFCFSPGWVLLGILGGVCRPVPQILTRPKNVIFNTRFQTEQAAITLVLLRLERKQKNSSNSVRIRIFLFLSYSFGSEMVNTFIHSRSSLENHTLFQTRKAKYFGAAHTYIAYIREYPPGCFPVYQSFIYIFSMIGLSPGNGPRIFYQ